MDDRAQSTGLANFGLSLVVGVVLFWILSLIGRPVIEQSQEMSAESDTVALRGQEYMGAFIDWWPILVVFIAMFSLLALAVFQREVLR